nr:MMPL family transporter [bacterium]
MTEDKKLRLAEAFVGFLGRFRYAVILGLLVIAAFSVTAMKNIRFDNSDESFFAQDDPAILAINRFHELFGNEDNAYIAVRTKDGVFRHEMLVRLEALASALEDNVPHIKKVTWIGSAEYIRSEGEDGIKTGPIYDEMPDAPEDLERFKKITLSHPDFVDTLISRDANTAVIVLECRRYPENIQDPRKEIAPAIYSVLARNEFADLETVMAGAPIYDFEKEQITKRQTGKLTLLCLILQVILLLRIGKGGLRAVIAPVCVITLTIMFTMGIVGLSGWPMSMMDIMLPTLLFTVCMGDTVHIIAHYHMYRDSGIPHMQAMTGTVKEIFFPCLFTSLTTMVGFLSFMATEVVPIKMAGLYSAIGVGLAFILAISLTPIIYMIRPEKDSRFSGQGRLSATASHRRLDDFLQKAVKACLRHPVPVIAFFFAVTGMSVWLFQSVVIETNSIKDLRTVEKLRRDSDFFDEHLGGAMSLEIMVDSGHEDGAKDLGFLRDIKALQRHAEAHPKTVKTHSVVDTIATIREVVHGDDPAYHDLPDEQNQVSQYLFFYETSGGKNLDKEMSLLNDVVRLHVQTRNMGTQDVKEFVADMERFAADELKGRIHLECTGQMAWMTALADYVKAGQSVSLLSAAISICLLMIACLRSIKLGLISMIPNIVPVLFAMGLMGLFGIRLSLPLMIFSCVIMGVCVDDTTHFYVYFRNFFAQ